MLNPIFEQLGTFFFVFIRVIAIFSAIPFLGSKIVPVKVKIGLSLLIGIILTPVLGVHALLPESIAGLAIGIMREALIGIAIGFMVKLVFSSMEIAGQVAGMQMGFAVANVIDPQTSSQISVLAQVYNLIGILIFFTLNMHIIFISVIKESFAIIPPYGFSVTRGMMDGFLTMTADMCRIAVKLAAPIMVSILITNIAMGIMARTVPQLNVFVLGFPITIILGLVVLLFSMPFITSVIGRAYTDLSYNLIDLLKMGGRGG
ncbi:MAG: flagellar biosynthetic protein FliR [Deltaproteobacteria bacterium]|nr:flagellar biosynthetic protein FliR [Deltaproteobacteria bacterium]